MFYKNLKFHMFYKILKFHILQNFKFHDIAMTGKTTIIFQGFPGAVEPCLVVTSVLCAIFP